MKLTRYQLFLLGGLLVIIMGPLAFTQPGPGNMQIRMGGGGKGPNSDFMFNMLSGGKDSFNVNSVQLPEWLTRREPADKQKERMLTYLQKKGVSNGEMTKANYA